MDTYWKKKLFPRLVKNMYRDMFIVHIGEKMLIVIYMNFHIPMSSNHILIQRNGNILLETFSFHVVHRVQCFPKKYIKKKFGFTLGEKGKVKNKYYLQCGSEIKEERRQNHCQ